MTRMLLLSILILFAAISCRASKEHDDHAHDEGASSYKEGKGIKLGLKSKEAMGMVITEVGNLPMRVRAGSIVENLQGSFVFLQNEDYFIRQAVTIREDGEDHVLIVDGIYPGDQLVEKPVTWLYLVELQFTRAGSHSH